MKILSVPLILLTMAGSATASDDPITRIINRYDVDRDGKVGDVEFMSHKIVTSKKQFKRYMEVFRVLDDDKDGYITRADLERIYPYLQNLIELNKKNRQRR